MKKSNWKILSILAASFVLTLGQAQASNVEYGVVTQEKAVEVGKDNSTLATVGGGLVGGVLGYTVGKGSSAGKKRRGIILGTAGGALLGKEATKDSGKVKANQYTVDLVDGETVEITTEQGQIDVGDCVTIERGESANIRRVSQVHCEGKDAQASEEHITEAQECVTAKAAISDAETDEEIAAAVEKARLRCEE